MENLINWVSKVVFYSELGILALIVIVQERGYSFYSRVMQQENSILAMLKCEEPLTEVSSGAARTEAVAVVWEEAYCLRPLALSKTFTKWPYTGFLTTELLAWWQKSGPPLGRKH